MTFFRLGESATRPASVTAPQRPRAAVAPRRTAAAVAAGAATSTAGAWTEF
jgi:hypothetical protein